MLLPKPPENIAVAVGVSRSSALLRKAAEYGNKTVQVGNVTVC